MSQPLPTGRDWDLVDDQWANILNPIVTSPFNNSILIMGLKLLAGKNIINHGLGKLMIGWSLVDINGPATIYRSSPLNDKTIALTSTIAVTINLEVF